MALALTSLILPASASPLSYTYISLDYDRFNSGLDKYTSEIEGNALSLNASFAVRPHIAIVAGYSKGQADMTTAGIKVGAEVESASLGVIAHLPINETADFILGAAFINGQTSADGSSENEDADGGLTTIGARAMATDNLEISGFIQRSRIEDDTNFSLRFGAGYFFDETVSLDLNCAVDTDGGLIGLGISKHF